MFKRAERKRAFIKLAVTGPSGSGKTYSALRLAFGLGKKVAVLDTENGSASLYASLGEYDACEITAPFTVKKYLDVVDAAVAGGYDVLVIDSLTHEWDGEGGLLDQKDALDKRGGNSFTNWATITKQHKEFVAAILHAPIHVIGTMRSKTEYVVEQGQGGKSQPKKLGLAPVQRDGMEYEFTTVFDIALDHTAAVSKDRTGLFNGLCSTLTEEHGLKIRQWLESGATPAPERPQEPAPQFQRPVSAPAPTADEPRRSIWAAESSGDRRATAAVQNAERPQPVAGSEPTPGSMACTFDGCGKSLTKGQHDVSVRAFAQPLCPEHQKERAKAGA